ncbi:MAG: ABC transporter ATP-binding protein [Natronomonas sp.]|jgi:branched-chain amino acid transport system ATP-binding protein|uniref:Probable branched-chain amino acid transport ATP-binding protein LivG n=1 Tax=Natronomonas salsuginis TaxID=2217661 RepID=A0A4U5JC50_9EURY|nr:MULTISPECIES: ABC transporter ATP-binding protein [Natronomonas]MDR9381810.1 ABC transporter ATP-binding protein [Natronomonas sp.]MDR9430541.1 ABC transporter ATP-binding protein [Natronomonas sp.]TKR26195.1 ABC transporter ATP-binding protein [Natronomonas salsuginis]
MSAVLRTEGLTKEFGGLTAVEDVDFELEENELHCIIGPNGAGKTTFFNLITGGLEPTEGSVYLSGEDIVGKEPREIVDQGLARSFQISQLFNGLTVMENIRLALLGARERGSIFKFLFSNIESDEELKAEAYDIVERVRLGEEADKEVSSLAHGKKRNLEIGVALSTGADVLLLDEPAAGLTTAETEELMDLIREIGKDRTILLVEHDMNLVMGLAETITVLHNGRVLAQGSPDTIRSDETVKEVYLGE